MKDTFKIIIYSLSCFSQVEINEIYCITMNLDELLDRNDIFQLLVRNGLCNHEIFLLNYKE